jgi:small subunit ribosomal protein S20
MPNTASAKKRLRQSVVRRDRNRSAKSALRTQIKKVRKALSEGDAEASKTEFQAAAKKLDQAAGKNIIHANRAARIKSRLSRAVKKLSIGPAPK